MPATKMIKLALPPASTPCRQPSHGKKYPAAIRLVKPKETGGRESRVAWAVCGDCAGRMVRELRFRLVEEGERYTLATVPYLEVKDDQRNAKKPAEQMEQETIEEDPDAPTDGDRKDTVALVRSAMDLEDQIAFHQQEIARLSEGYQLIVQTELPAKMKLIGMTEIPLTDGTIVKLDDIVSANIREADRPKAFKWLKTKAAGGAPLVKNIRELSFGMGQEKLAQAFDKLVTPFIKKYKLDPMKAKEYVHPGSLTKFVKEKKKLGKDIDPSITVYEGTVAKIVRPKAPTEVDGM